MTNIEVLEKKLSEEQRLRKADLAAAVDSIGLVQRYFKDLLYRGKDDINTVFTLVIAVLDPFVKICELKIEQIDMGK